MMDTPPPDKLVHGPKEQDPRLQRLGFLVGHFQGEGQYLKGSRQFQKDVVGAWQAGGQFLSLRMRVTYPLQLELDGRLDVHDAFVVVGINPANKQLEARAYTDGGGMIDYQLEVSGPEIYFPDRLPGHQSQTKALRARKQRARKVLCPHENGFEERLEVDFGTGDYEPYSRIIMIKEEDAVARPQT